MTIEEIMKIQFFLSQSRSSHPELKALISKIMCTWGEKSSKYGITVLSRYFHKGR